jgi:hypothetical protein
MGFEKGHPKYGGIKKGETQRERRVVREIVEECLGSTLPQRLLSLAKNSPKLEIQILEGLMPYCYPRLQSVEMNAEIADVTDDVISQLTQELILMQADQKDPN